MPLEHQQSAGLGHSFLLTFRMVGTPGSEQPGLVEDVPVYGRGLELGEL